MKKTVRSTDKVDKVELNEMAAGTILPYENGQLVTARVNSDLSDGGRFTCHHLPKVCGFEEVYSSMDAEKYIGHQELDVKKHESICKAAFVKDSFRKCFGCSSPDKSTEIIDKHNFKNRVTPSPQVKSKEPHISYISGREMTTYREEAISMAIEDIDDRDEAMMENDTSDNTHESQKLKKSLAEDGKSSTQSQDRCCGSMPRLNCCSMPRLNCGSMPRLNCGSMPRLNCGSMPRQNCGSIWRQRCGSIMGKYCSPIQQRGMTVAPQSRLYLFWLFVVTLAYLYNITTILLRTAFTVYYTKDNYHLWLIADYISDFIYLLDLAVVKPRVQFIKSGLLQTKFFETKQNYLRSSEFKLDLVSLLPLDFFYFLTGVLGSAPLLRLPRYLKLKSVWEFFDRCDQAAKSGYIIRVIRTMIYMLFLIHVEACGYYAVSVYEGLGSNQWVYSADSNGNAYIRCFYLATKTATSIGNNPRPTNQLEYMFMIVYWLSGVFVFALLIGQIRDIFESANSVKSSYQKAQDSTLQHLQNLNVPKSVQNKVRDWFNYNWAQQKTLNENLLVDVLPTKMKTDLFISVHYETLSKVSLFQDCDRSLLSDLILKLMPVIFLPGDYICRKGEVGTEMYIIMHGEVEVVGDGGVVLATLTKGKVFGEISLMGLAGGNRRTANVQSKGYSNLFVLSKHDFDRAMQDYPSAYALLKKRAQKLLTKNEKGTEVKEKTSNGVVPNHSMTRHAGEVEVKKSYSQGQFEDDKG